MSAKTIPAVILFLVSTLLTGCNNYSHYGYGRSAASQLDAVSVTPLELPANAPSISQRFRPVGVSAQSEHKGFDILVPSSTAVLAAAAGEVSRLQTPVLCGRQFMIDNGYVASGRERWKHRIQTRYFHLSQREVALGDRMQRGQFVGYSGASGLAGGFPHLYFEVHRRGMGENPVAVRFVNPQVFWADGVGRISCYEPSREWVSIPVVLTYPVPWPGLDRS